MGDKVEATYHGTPVVGDARRASWVETIEATWWTGGLDYRERTATALMALADVEQAALVERVAELEAEVERLTALVDLYRAEYERPGTQQRPGCTCGGISACLACQDADADPLRAQLVRENIELRDRAEGAEAKVAAVEAEVERLQTVAEVNATHASKMTRRAEAAETKVKAVKALHWPHKSDVFVSGTEWCDVEGEDWPCPTILTIRGDQDVDPHPDIVGALEDRAALASVGLTAAEAPPSAAPESSIGEPAPEAGDECSGEGEACLTHGGCWEFNDEGLAIACDQADMYPDPPAAPQAEG